MLSLKILTLPNIKIYEYNAYYPLWYIILLYGCDIILAVFAMSKRVSLSKYLNKGCLWII
jgi:hypothetical protein